MDGGRPTLKLSPAAPLLGDQMIVATPPWGSFPPGGGIGQLQTKCPWRTIRYHAPGTCGLPLTNPGDDAFSITVWEAGPYTSAVVADEAPPITEGFRIAALICCTSSAGRGGPLLCLLPPQAAHASVTTPTTPMTPSRCTLLRLIRLPGLERTG